MLVTTQFSQNVFFHDSQKKSELYTVLKQHERINDDRIFIFGRTKLLTRSLTPDFFSKVFDACFPKRTKSAEYICIMWKQAHHVNNNNFHNTQTYLD